MAAIPAGNILRGLRHNWQQFGLLILINALVGSMIGMERVIVPRLAGDIFGLTTHTAMFSFIGFFGMAKALTNYLTGGLSSRYGRKAVLVGGWVLALPVPLMLLEADTWTWVIMANILLGISQGLTWSTTVVMKIDLAGDHERGLAMGINEFAGYVSVGLMALLTSQLADVYGLRPYPFWAGLGIALLGLLLSWGWVKDTTPWVRQEAPESRLSRRHNLFRAMTWQDRHLSAVTQAGLVNNLNDGMIWGLWPILLSRMGIPGVSAGIVIAAYPMVWGISQLFTGRIGDYYPARVLLATGMGLQGLTLLLVAQAGTYPAQLVLSSLLGLGTALVYPVFLLEIARRTHPQDRAGSLGVFRFWRDMGYVVGALLSGVLADTLGIVVAIRAVGGLTIVSGLVVWIRMVRTL